MYSPRIKLAPLGQGACEAGDSLLIAWGVLVGAGGHSKQPALGHTKVLGLTYSFSKH